MADFDGPITDDILFPKKQPKESDDGFGLWMDCFKGCYELTSCLSSLDFRDDKDRNKARHVLEELQSIKGRYFPEGAA